MGNADEWYLLIITQHFPASGSQLHHGAAPPTRLVLGMMPGLGSCHLMPGFLLSACSGLFGCFDYPLGLNSRDELGFFICLCWGGFFFFFFQISSPGLSVFSNDRSLAHQKRFLM